MKTIILNLCLFLILAPPLARGQVIVSGEITPAALLRINDGSLINLPFRLGNITLGYAVGDFELVTNTAIETRWEDGEFDDDMVQFREAYLMWYPSFGEIKLGKMIQAWGAADANNPTDNLSPYDYYYMFMADTDRKLGSMSINTKIYAGDFQLELVALPRFVENRVPYDEPEFPIQIVLPSNSETLDVEDELELGARLQYASGLGDLSASIFQGHDRMLSGAGFKTNIFDPNGEIIAPVFAYRETRMYGLDGVLFPGNWTIRGEFAYFQTETPVLEIDASRISTEATYLQSVVQLEYAFSNGLQLMGQFISTDYGDITTVLTPDSSFLKLPDPIKSAINIPEFQAGLGTPFAMISERVLVFSSMIEMLDNSLELGGMVMINLDETGYMTNLSSSYTLAEGVKLTGAVAYFVGGDELGNSFKQLEDFSNLNVGLSYNF